MPVDADPDGAEVSDVVPTDEDGEVEVYETDEGIVLYDAGNPLAWIESRLPVRLEDVA